MWNRRCIIRCFDYKFVKKKENGQRLVFAPGFLGWETLSSAGERDGS